MRRGFVFFTLVIAAAAYGQSQAPTVSPDGSRIVFVSDREGMTDLYVIAADGTHETRLTHTPEKEGRADWSPDGRRIWFSVVADEVSRIYAIDVDGKNLRQIGSVPGRSARLSRNGKRVAYARGSWTEMQFLAADLDGSNVRQLNDGKSIAWGPQWSPNGKEIAYGTRDVAKHLNVWIMRADGSHPRQITTIPAETGEAQMPAWSSDGRRLAFQVSHAPTKSGRLWIVDVRRGGARPLDIGGQHQDEVPYWFPDGKRLAFQSDRSGRMEIWVVNVDGTGVRQLTR